ncbi:Ribose 5-phosphate isomerase B [Spiroplasma clarkii]|uniref:Galactose-6-phosphate isomerase n=1 Tax=Spiroplasma clarkii TaxID=2139 RepID=A0A1Y0KZ33_9MOLU|nr:RpiB/LacA/LacB family sugar-phosphate isomerase [Spiroplasma clarkii]ARU90987.1 Ribose 5-phosphate isomerase B [Spiroplasma clarkii]ATX70427.1 galactose-6-phosphate isomerase [Spiroplasma clarkii]
MENISIYINKACPQAYRDYLLKNIKATNFQLKVIEEKDQFNDLVSLAQQIQKQEIARAIIIDEFGTLPFLVMGKFKKVVVAQISDHHSARMTIQHNNSNVLAVPFQVMAVENMVDIINTYLTANFEAGRHMVRINMLDVILKEE